MEQAYTYKFGKIDATDNGKKSNSVEIEVKLSESREGLPVFSASAMVWNAFHTDIIRGGQCLDYIAKTSIGHNKAFRQIYDMWQKHHLNDMHAGTPAQEAALEQAVADGKLSGYGANNYEATCDYLRSIDLYEDKEYLVVRDGEPVPYKYGSGWLTQQIPEADLAVIKDMVEGKLKVKSDKQVDR